MAITYLVAGLLTPFFGAAIDYLGYRAVLVFASAIAITGVHLMLALTTIPPTVPLVLLGVCYSIYASALWPSIAVSHKGRYQLCFTTINPVPSVSRSLSSLNTKLLHMVL